MSSDDTPQPHAGDDAPATEYPTAPTAGELESADEAAAALGRREAVREKAQQVRLQQTRARRVRTLALAGGVTAAVAVVAVVVAWAIGASASRPQLSPHGAKDDGFIVTSISTGSSVSSPDDVASPSATPLSADATPVASPTETAPVDIHVYVDYLSPSAKDWQLANKAQLSTWVTEGAATLTYHPVAMLTAKSNGTKYSLRAAGAAACVATYAPNNFFSFNDDLLTRQPAVDSDGFSDKDLADIALANGSDDPTRLRECIEDGEFSAWVKAATERAVSGIEGSDGLSLTGNSLITVNGQAYVGDPTDPAEFSQFVLTSASGKAAKAQSSPSPTPSVTP
ncbi:MAG: protein-disulfide isomerase [Microbacterium sp.]|nr:MAG: protein-disulfide isomerase [Microbacterium sp.]